MARFLKSEKHEYSLKDLGQGSSGSAGSTGSAGSSGSTGSSGSAGSSGSSGSSGSAGSSGSSGVAGSSGSSGYDGDTYRATSSTSIDTSKLVIGDDEDSDGNPIFVDLSTPSTGSYAYSPGQDIVVAHYQPQNNIFIKILGNVTQYFEGDINNVFTIFNIFF